MSFEFINLRAVIVETDKINAHDLVLRPDGSVWLAVAEAYQNFTDTMMTMACLWPIFGDIDNVKVLGPVRILKIVGTLP